MNVFSSKFVRVIATRGAAAIAVTLTGATLMSLAQQSAPTNGQVPSGPISAPANTVGNTPSSVTGSRSAGSGYSASGNTVNTNINNTQVGGRSLGQPIGNGSQTVIPGQQK